MTITEKILAAHCGKKKISPGEFINAMVDFALGNDVTAPFAIDELKKARIKKVFNREKIALVPDHFSPNKDVASAQQCKKLAEFAKAYNIKYYFEQGRAGIEHVLLPEAG
ncbi:MAG: 3-isopropylmalate dehydratase large subunit, partial [Candidatus Omnitrophota bacterium]